MDLSNDFTTTVALHGQIIINEMHLAAPEKSIQPVDIGGLAGGEKFIADGILFKLGSNADNIYPDLE